MRLFAFTAIFFKDILKTEEEVKVMLEKAILLAETAHRGQVDKGGEPYILHPKRVMEHCEATEEKIVAILHDVIEDTEITAEDLKNEGFSAEVIEAVVCLTKKDGEDYMDYVDRVCKNRLAARVKLADLNDNMNLSRILHPTEKDFARVEKYKKAKARIEQALRG